jgi:hypothetical protein
MSDERSPESYHDDKDLHERIKKLETDVANMKKLLPGYDRQLQALTVWAKDITSDTNDLRAAATELGGLVRRHVEASRDMYSVLSRAVVHPQGRVELLRDMLADAVETLEKKSAPSRDE